MFLLLEVISCHAGHMHRLLWKLLLLVQMLLLLMLLLLLLTLLLPLTELWLLQ